MFGQNIPVRVDDGDTGLNLLVREVFPTFQGEGPFTGWPAVFVRLGGCHLRCWFCDTDFEVERSERVRLADLLAKIEDLMPPTRDPLVVITGGEPLAQNIGPLVVHLLSRPDWRVQVETSGGPRWWSDLPVGDERFSLVVSPKSPRVDPLVGRLASAWKYVVGYEDHVDIGDGLPVVNPQGRSGSLARPMNKAPVYLQPCDHHDPELTAAATRRVTELATLHGYRISVQTHKILEVP